MLTFLLAVTLGLFYCSKESNQSSLGIPRLFGPSEAFVSNDSVFNCELLRYPKDEMILLQLFKEGNRKKSLGDYTSLDGDIASFSIVIKKSHEGNLECVAKAQNNSNIEPTVSRTHYLRVVEPVQDARIEILSDQRTFYEGGTLELNCSLTAGNHVSYKWLLNGRLIPRDRLHHSRLFINRTASNDSGLYTCVATNSFKRTKIFTTNSSVVITVMELVSDPNISITVSKEDSRRYSAVITCHCAKGTPPIYFSLHNRTELVADRSGEGRTTTFKVPLVLGKHMGQLQCQASNGDRTAYSEWIPLEVVPVSGPVTMHYDYDVGENYAVTDLRFYCKALKGSLPRYQWFINKTLLRERGSFYYVVDQPPKQSILLLSVGRSSAGTYHCEVSDSFDNSTAISSKKQYMDREVLNRLPDLVVAVVFGCFTFVVLLVCVCCGVGVVFRRRLYGDKSLLDLKMERMAAVFNGEPSLSKYNEDADVVNTARGAEFDQVSEASVDEWPQIEEEKKTLEDEPVEEP